MNRTPFFHFLVILLLIPAIFPTYLFAQSAAEIRNQIDTHSKEIQKIDQEIAQYEKDLKVLGTKKSTLQNTIAELDLSKKKLIAEINKLKNSISSTELEIQQLDTGIVKTQGVIGNTKSGLSETLRRMDEFDSISFATAVLSTNVVTATWNSVNQLEQVQGAIGDHITLLKGEKVNLETNKNLQEQKRATLLTQKNTLSETQGSVEATRRAQADILKQTKSTESEYQLLLKKKKAAKEEFESALLDLEARLKIAIDPSQILAGGKGILRWPVDNVKVSQYFGNTQFAQSGAYAGKGHNGIDLAIPIGTIIRSADGGTVIGSGNTDNVYGCYSFGRWLMVKHNNGLSTLYAHLSQSSVATGDTVTRGQILGYSGMTGYATGPHLHFGVYVSSAVQIIKLGSATNRKTACSDAVMPVAPVQGYLNPMNYL